MSFFNTSRFDGYHTDNNRYLNFSDRLTTWQPGYSADRARSQDSANAENDLQEFENIIPEATSRPSNKRTKRKYRLDPDNASNSSEGTVRPRSRVSTILWPTLAITVPIALLCATLLGTVYGFRVNSQPDIFASAESQPGSHDNSFVLVNYSATRLVFIASFLSSVAPILAGFIMTLWTLPIAQSMRLASTTAQYSKLPTPYQLSLIIGISLASYERLWRYFGYLTSKQRSSVPRVLHGAAAVLSGAILLSAAVFATDTYLHYTTQTVSFDQIANSMAPETGYGRGLDEYCLNFNRSRNGGLPCSYDTFGIDPDFTEQQNELFYLQHNTSRTSEIRFISSEDLPHGDLAVLVPQSHSLSSGVDFGASTIGVSSQCVPITTECDMRYSTVADGFHTLFNCSENFWGALGKSPNISELDGFMAPDSSISPLAYKPAANLQYGFLADEGLKTLYNSVGYDIETEQSTLTDSPPRDTSISDDQLLNPIYLALAGRFAVTAESAGSSLNKDPGMFVDVGVRFYADFVLRCSLTTYEVNYAWVQGNVQNASFVPTTNGTLLEIFHGSQLYVSVNGGGFDLQDYLLQAALQNTSDSFARSWANLYSTKILSTIGAFSTSRSTLQEQIRTPLLVAKVQVSALAALVACSLAYTILGMFLGINAYRASAVDVRDIAAQLSLPGLTAAAFGSRAQSPDTAGSQGSGIVFSEKLTRNETRRVVIDGGPDTGYEFRVWV